MGMIFKGVPRRHSGKESACQCRRCKRCGFDPWVGKTAWSGKRQHTPVLLPVEFHGQKTLLGCSPWGHKESDTTEQLIIVLISTAHDFDRRKKIIKGFPGGPIVRNQPCNARDTGLTPGLVWSHMPWSNWACETQLLSQYSRDCKLQLLKPVRHRVYGLQPDKPLQW